MTLADVLSPQALLPASPTAWAAALLLVLALMAARQWGFRGLIALAATLPGARPATEAAHRQRFLRIDAERLALSAPALIGSVGAVAATMLGQPLVLAAAALAALPCMLGTARFCVATLGVPGLLPAAAAVGGGAGAFAAGVLLGALAPLLLLAREGRWTPHLLVQAPLLGARRLAGHG
jgi:hypothetical protein